MSIGIKPLVIVIVGPTASGKSELAVKVAKKFDGEIISADSRQVYKGLNIGVAKVSGTWKIVGRCARKRTRFVYKGIPHHCIDFASVRRAHTVAEFKERAEHAIRDILGRGKLPIIAGGTGFWVDSLIYDVDLPAVPPNPLLRRRLERLTPDRLLVMLKKFDPRRAEVIEQKNPRRLIRAIEIARTLGSVPSLRSGSPYNHFFIGIRPEFKALARVIGRRAREQACKGLVGETKKLLTQGVAKHRIQELGFEYRLALEALEGTILRADLAHHLAKATCRYAKRQMTWWKKHRDIHWAASPKKAWELLLQLGPVPSERHKK